MPPPAIIPSWGLPYLHGVSGVRGQCRLTSLPSSSTLAKASCWLSRGGGAGGNGGAVKRGYTRAARGGWWRRCARRWAGTRCSSPPATSSPTCCSATCTASATAAGATASSEGLFKECTMKALPLQTVLVLHLVAIFAGACQDFSLRSSIKKRPFNTSFGSFDDQYKDCDPGMEAELKSPLNTDFANKEGYAEVWIDATSRWNRLPYFVTSRLEPRYGTAVVAYTDERSLCRDFNRAVEEAGRSGKAPFPFRSFHFLLTRALQILQESQRKCYKTYRGVKGIHFTIADYGKPVRFGRFASSSLSASVAFGVGTDTLFIIETCFGVDIQEFSYRREQKEVLIPPYEKFHIIKFQEVGGTIFIELSSHGRLSTYNCGVENAAGPGRLSANVPAHILLLGLLLVSGALGSLGIS